MATNVRSSLRRVLARIEVERNRVQRQIAAIEHALRVTAPSLNGSVASRSRKLRNRKPMSATARKAVSKRMKAYWAKRRAKVTRK